MKPADTVAARRPAPARVLAEHSQSSVPPAPVRAMLDPSFYRDGVERVELVETHVSWVLIAGQRVYKVRKPVTFPFLDYGTAGRRREMSVEEVRLGRRLAPGVYLGVRSIVESADGHFELGALDTDGAVEYAVEMHKYDASRTLAALLARGEVRAEDIRRLAHRLVAFHGAAERLPAGAFSPRTVAASLSENFSTLLPYAEQIGPARLAAAHRFAVAFVHGKRRLLEARSTAGHIRDCHGDIRAEQVVLADEVTVPDPVEFDPALRQIDVAADLAFLIMDLHAAGHDPLAKLLAHEYEAAGGDHGGQVLLAFYASYRAWVRVKVGCLQASMRARGEPGREAAFAHARALAATGSRLAWRARGSLTLVVCGRSASGKSTLARELAARSGLPILSTDLIRKELAGIAPTTRAGADQYSEAASVRTYRELGVRAAAAPGGAIVDGTFRKRSHRDAFADGYGDSGRPLFISCEAPLRVLLERARIRSGDEQRISDAGPEVVAWIARELESLVEVPAADRISVHTDQPIAAVADLIEAWLDALLAEGEL